MAILIVSSSSLNPLIPILLLHLPWLLYVHGTACPPPPPPPLPPPIVFADQRLAVVYPVIQKFKSTITSDPLGVTSTWVGGDICSYKGFYCSNPPDNETATAVAAIDFNGFQLGAPTLDGFIDALPDLAIFHANTNNFTGTISPKIATLPYFYELDLSNNRFFGEFPPAVLNIPDLSFLDIRFNSFSGYVPPQVFALNLDVLFINNNAFSHRIPEDFGNTTARYLTFANNRFTGPIPRSIGKTSSTLTEILFLNNFLSGCLPTEIGYLKQLTVFDVSDNLLTGPLPCSLGCLSKAEQLNFAGNFFYGKVPEELCALGNLFNLSLSDNYFTRAGPICRRQIRNGIVDVRHNCIRDLPDQRSIAECLHFFLKPRPACINLASYEEIPCKEVAMDSSPTRLNTPKVTYAALGKHS